MPGVRKAGRTGGLDKAGVRFFVLRAMAEQCCGNACHLGLTPLWSYPATCM